VRRHVRRRPPQIVEIEAIVRSTVDLGLEIGLTRAAIFDVVDRVRPFVGGGV
jgi:hypothetical protein